MASTLQDIVLVATGWLHVLLSPYTKVEESFNLHATHDVLMYGFDPFGGFEHGDLSLYNYDHFTFPGAVPRTFIGSIALAFLAKPFIHLANATGIIQNKIDIQIIVRLVLATANTFGLILIRRATAARFGRQAGLFFTLLTISQFHLPFWMGRTLPNMFALLPVNIATAMLLKPSSAQYKRKNASLVAISLLIFAAVVFRAELALLLTPILVQYVAETLAESPNFTRRLRRIQSLIKVGLLVGLGSIAATIVVDSYFWDHPAPLWPEFESVWFNIFEGKSVEWGVSPFHTYFTSSLPKLLLTAFPLALPSIFTPLLLSAITFVCLISCLGHKEWRFIIYVVPIFNVAASRTLAKLRHLTRSSASTSTQNTQRSILTAFIASASRLFLSVIPFVPLMMNIIVTTFTTTASVLNYPGGEAMNILQFRLAAASTINSDFTMTARVHICNLAAQTGASLFTQAFSEPHLSGAADSGHIHVIYNKTEGLTPDELISSANPKFTHIIVEVQPADFLKATDGWRVVAGVHGFERWRLDWNSLTVLRAAGTSMRSRELLSRLAGFIRLELRERLWILERTEWTNVPVMDVAP